MKKVAIVGRPNVGKSTLVNRIVGRQEAIVEEKAGVTRDKKSYVASWRGVTFEIVDTGGFLAEGDELEEKISQKSLSAMGECDVALLVVDAAVGLTNEDSDVAKVLRRTKIPIIVVANKAESEARQFAAWEFAALGFDDLQPVSALHGTMTGDLLDLVVDKLGHFDDIDGEEGKNTTKESDIFAVAIIGRPNVGKSTLFNRLVGDDLSVVHDMPGTTTDSVDTIVETEIGTLRFVDTAGMRRRANQSSGTEYYSMVRALKSIDRADVAILVVDGQEGVTHQDQRLAERIDAAGSPVVVVLNKWEELSAEEKVVRGAEAEEKLAFLTYAPFIRISAKTGLATHRILPAVQNAIVAYRQRIPTRELNVAIAEFQSIHPPKGTKILYAVQGATDPPTFTLFSSRPIDNSYMRYLERKLRERFALGPTPIKMRVRRRSDG
ncbi:MAG: ribosome biogenesis GTPase Der [Actinomycetota bacterium]|nr:ribosome biogenesis GTPase Der [Actinomycetota bacterium]